ncbi:MAG TPA: hypothetical protein VKQ30_00755 [Ktedonobacterales bacterium]|nr:hypothetical protein [Ktedonobacterales bacterium]
MDSLILKLVLTPALIGIASLAGRRWGPAVSGWLVGLPLTSGPIAFFLALSSGRAFATAAATGILTGTLSQAAFSLAYAWPARRLGWPRSLAAGCLAFGAVTFALEYLLLPIGYLFVIAVATLVLTLRLLPARAKGRALFAVTPPRWDLPARMVVATGFVVLLTASASALGPHLTGLLSPFPIYASILTIFAHHEQGSGAATNVLRGLLLGLFAFASFFLVLGTLLEPLGIAPAFALAVVAALLVQGASLWVLRRGQQHLMPT